MKLLPRQQHTADSLQHTAIRRPCSPALFRPHPSALILVLALPCLLVSCVSPEPTQERPDRAEIRGIVSPLGLSIGEVSLDTAVTARKVEEIDSALLAADPMYLLERFHPHGYGGWYILRLPLTVTNLLPGVSFYLGVFAGAFSRGYDIKLMAQRGEQYYELPYNLVQLLQEAGVGFSPADSQPVLLAAVAFAELHRAAQDMWLSSHTSRDSAVALLTQHGQLTPVMVLDSMRFDKTLTFFVDSASTDTLTMNTIRIFCRTPDSSFILAVRLQTPIMQDGSFYVYPWELMGPLGRGSSFGHPDWEQLGSP